jgi:hypothetical protein
MKKIIYVSFFILIGFCFSTYSVDASEKIILSEEGGLTISSDAFVKNEDGIFLIKNSDLNIIYKYPTLDLEEIEPNFILKIYDESREDVIYELKTPDFSNLVDGQDTDLIFESNQEYFKSTQIYDDKIELLIPLKLETGRYNLILEIDLEYGPVQKIEHTFNVYSSNYIFSNSQLTIENSDFLFNSNYESFGGSEENVTISLSVLDKNLKQVFTKEIDSTLYQNGSISTFENIPKFKGEHLIKINILNKNKEILFEYSETKNIESNQGILALIILILVLSTLLIIFIIFKKKKILIMIFMFISVSTYFNISVYAQEESLICGNKPADACQENKTTTSACLVSETCSSPSYSRNFFSTGKPLSEQSQNAWVGPVSVNINICQHIPTLTPRSGFYVISDAVNSSWITKKYSVFQFVQGTPQTITFDPGGDKRNVNYAVYDGGCNVRVSGRYSGKSSDFKRVQTTVVEVGEVTDTMCKSSSVNSGSFNSSGLVNKQTCSQNSDFSLDTSIVNRFSTGKSLNMPSPRKWVGPVSVNVNICQNISSLPSGNNFYVISDAVNSDWISKRYSVFEFTKGAPKTITFDRGGKKRNVNYATYDGNCNVEVFGRYSGKSSNYKMAQTTVVEVGEVTNTMCKGNLYDFSNYQTNGSLLNLSGCFNNTCTKIGTWIPITTNQICTQCGLPPDNVNDNICIDGFINTYACPYQGSQWKLEPTLDKCSIAPSCTLGDYSAFIPPGAVTYTINNVPAASGPFTFKIGSLTAGTSNNGVYTHNYTSINATKINSVTFGTTTLACPTNSLTLTCPPYPLDHNQCQSDGKMKTYSYTDSVCTRNVTEGPCPSTNTGTPTAIFSFRPNIANTGGTCPFILSTTNAASCSLQKISGVDPIYTGTSTTGFGVGIGRYTLSCTDSAGASKLMGSASCYSNADVRED